MPAVPLPPPKNISPLIRAARWTALIAGIIYGANRYSYLKTREVEIQKHENEIREKYRIKKAAEDGIKMKAEMDALGKEAGMIPK